MDQREVADVPNGDGRCDHCRVRLTSEGSSSAVAEQAMVGSLSPRVTEGRADGADDGAYGGERDRHPPDIAGRPFSRQQHHPTEDDQSHRQSEDEEDASFAQCKTSSGVEATPGPSPGPRSGATTAPRAACEARPPGTPHDSAPHFSLAVAVPDSCPMQGSTSAFNSTQAPAT